MKNIIKILSIFAIFSLVLVAKPAKAFYLEVPQSVKDLFTVFKSEKVSAQESYTATTPPPTDSTQPAPYSGTSQPYPPQEGMMPPPSSGMTDQPMNQPYSMPPQQGMMQNNQGAPYGYNGQGMQGGQDNGKQLEQMKRGMSQMSRQVKQLEQMITSAEKKGTNVPEEIKQNLAKLKNILDSVSGATSMDDMQNIDTSEIQELMQSLDEYRRNVMEAQQRLDGMRRGMKGMEQGLKMFKTQISRLTKQKIAVPSDLTENITKLEAIVAAIKNAKTIEEMDAIDFESMQDLMQTLDENRQQLEALARWPQSLKQINNELTRLTRELTRSKTIVTRLTAKGIDLQSEYTAFEEAVNKLKDVRDDAVAMMAAGNSEEAFSTLEDDFFGQMDDVWQNQRIIMTMSNLSRFATEFKQNMARANSMVKNLKRKKVDTSELETAISQANIKGQEILALLKTKPVDTEAIIEALDELENIKQEFESISSELTGEEDDLPWEHGPQQFKPVTLPQGFDKFVPQK